LPPKRAKGVALGLSYPGFKLWQIPVQKQLHLDQKRINVVARQPVFDTWLDRQNVTEMIAMQFREQVGCHLVTRSDRFGRIVIDDEFIAEILDHQKACLTIASKDCRS